jgi:hypothetical protein
MQVPNNSSDKKWNNDLKMYLNPERAEANIAITRVKSVRKKDSKILPSSAIRIIKKKVKFKKGMATPKIPRFNKYIQRAVKDDLLKARKSDFHTVTFPNSIPVTILRLKAKETATFMLLKDIYFSLFTSENKRALAEIYTIAPRRLKDKIKVKINIKKLLRIIMSI